MKIYTDKTQSSYFASNNHIKDLKEINIKTIKEFVFNHNLDPLILVGIKQLNIGRFDELSSKTVDHYMNNYFNVDLIPNCNKYIDTLYEIFQHIKIDPYYLTKDIDQSNHLHISQKWLNNKCERYTISSIYQTDTLTITSNATNTELFDIAYLT